MQNFDETFATLCGSLIMDLRRLRYFTAVAEELHFGRAAQRMHVVQSAVSHQLKLLEEELGFSLLERSRHNVRLTVSGEIFLPEARDLLRRADEAMRRARASADGTVGRLAVGFVDNVLWSMLPPILRDFRQRWPQVELTLHPLDRSAQIEALRTSVIDIGIMPSPSPGHALKSVALAEAPLVAAIPEGHPLAVRPTLSIVELADESFVLFPRRMNSRLLEIIVTCCASAGFAPRIVQEAEQLHTLLALVSAGLGVTLVPQWVARVHQLGVVYIPIDDLLTPYELIAAWNSSSDNPAVANFRETAARIAGQMRFLSPSQ
ncbi:LysR family transcriptional regulator [Paraburkholderia sp. FT54]|uniref:LysR family transcriptional regulator n=1 Tax=Paraburkholderia sp. FT54 TaxID=3074437 RepID=UPI0028780FD0|nr:LysR family transcriptional regulator [Paraburkholderia sp. FT54]WNC94434.1 LysR family transcriptional regulator [Paraburkholderia sp. FT54]